MRKVCLTGGESTGKTQLARALARHCHAPMAKEFVRGYAARRHGPLEFADHGPIARGQMALEDAAIAAMGARVVEIGGTRDQRLAAAIAAIEAVPSRTA